MIVTAVYGSREQCLQTTTVSTNDGSQLGEYEVIVIVVCVCLSVLVLAVLVSVMYWCIHRRKAGNQGERSYGVVYKARETGCVEEVGEDMVYMRTVLPRG